MFDIILNLTEPQSRRAAFTKKCAGLYSLNNTRYAHKLKNNFLSRYIPLTTKTSFFSFAKRSLNTCAGNANHFLPFTYRVKALPSLFLPFTYQVKASPVYFSSFTYQVKPLPNHFLSFTYQVKAPPSTFCLFHLSSESIATAFLLCSEVLGGKKSTENNAFNLKYHVSL